MRVLLFLSQLQHPRMWRRANELAKKTAACTVIGFSRPTQQYPSDGKGVSLGVVEDMNYAKRVLTLARSVWRCRTFMKAHDVCYAFNLDNLVIAYLASKLLSKDVGLVYELADIRAIMTREGPLPAILRFVERYLVVRTLCVVLTSDAYYSGYFRDVQRLQGFKYLVINHKPDVPPELRARITQREFDGIVTIGYFGLIKSEISLRLLRDAVKAADGKLKVIVRGVFNYPITDEAAFALIDSAGGMMRYDGAYKSPEDLKSIYQEVDLIWDAYREGDNSKWQRTTRFSEACFFKRPLIVNESTQDGKLAGRFDIGTSIDFDDFQASIQKLIEIDEQRLKHWHKNLECLPESMLYYQDEYTKLVEAMTPTKH